MIHSATLHRIHFRKNTHAYIHSKENQKQTKKENESPFLCKITHFAAVATYSWSLWRPNCDLKSHTKPTDYHVHPFKAETHCCSFLAYCKPGRILCKLPNGKKKQMQFFFYIKKSCDYDINTYKIRSNMWNRVLKLWTWRAQKGAGMDMEWDAFKHQIFPQTVAGAF